METKEEIKKPKNGINKTAVLVALILGLSILLATLGYGYMNINYKNKVFEAEQKTPAEKIYDNYKELRRR